MPVQSHFLDMAITTVLAHARKHTHSRIALPPYPKFASVCAQAYGHSRHFALGTALQECPKRLRAAQKLLGIWSNATRFDEPVQRCSTKTLPKRTHTERQSATFLKPVSPIPHITSNGSVDDRSIIRTLHKFSLIRVFGPRDICISV